MKKTLINMDVNTLIGMIPGIVNRNNEIITNAFDEIYNSDSSAGYVKVPVNTTGSVRAVTGRFLNLECGPITFIDSSAMDDFYKTSVLFNHNQMFNRDIADQHPISAITGLSKELEDIHEQLNSIVDVSGGLFWKNVENVIAFKTLSINPGDENKFAVNKEYIKVYDNDIDMYTYPKSYYTKAPEYSTKKYKSAGDYNDIIYKHKYNYINVFDKYLKINNSNSWAFNATEPGVVVNIIFDDKTNMDNNDFIIKLSSDKNNFKHIRIKYSDIDLVTLTLICTDINKYGTQWRILNYNGKLEIE